MCEGKRDVFMEHRGQLPEVTYFIPHVGPSDGTEGLYQAWQRAPLSTEPSHLS